MCPIFFVFVKVYLIQEFMEGGPLLKEEYAVERIPEDTAMNNFIQVKCALAVPGVAEQRPSGRTQMKTDRQQVLIFSESRFCLCARVVCHAMAVHK